MKPFLPKEGSLKKAVHTLEDSILVLSGPTLAISGIIAGLDLLTGGHAMQGSPVLTFAWAITLLISLDFQVLTLGVRAKRLYMSKRSGKHKAGEIAIAVLIAGAISYVSIQMQSIVARVNASGLSIDQATAQLGINAIALTWERSSLVLILIFLSGWFRDHDGDRAANTANSGANIDHAAAITQLTEQLQALARSVTQITTTVTEVKTTVTAFTQGEHYIQHALPERTAVSDQDLEIDEAFDRREHEPIAANTEDEHSLIANAASEQDTLGDRIKAALRTNPGASDHKIAKELGCSSSTVNKWRRRVQEGV